MNCIKKTNKTTQKIDLSSIVANNNAILHLKKPCATYHLSAKTNIEQTDWRLLSQKKHERVRWFLKHTNQVTTIKMACTANKKKGDDSNDRIMQNAQRVI